MDSTPARGVCEDPAVELVVTLDEPCPSEPFVAGIRQVAAEGGRLRIVGEVFTPPATGRVCSIVVGSLGEEVAERVATALSGRVHDAYVATGPTSIEFRDTSLCDGPPANECPLVFAAETGLLGTRVASGVIDIAWGEDVCEGECGRLRALDVSLDLDERIEASVEPGAIGDLGVTHFANLRSWNTCTDEPSLITWAFWAG